ncbi:putative zinc-binding metallopeptidase [Psychromarinibacter sp. C21-152]|uniref:Zinc-binding metallopeptidase n=1 Tax=Psychromarinibacter sediminicola TaxID=3033385 RepID=A0AAE3NZ98_9RHOB|nr:putative zinc-binding metallopeptidase [Psychromarinibacter sediminicola]MDF0603630.1 putative zinc-binding metallopeptidase [Psychromarinibacter sediminicola]
MQIFRCPACAARVYFHNAACGCGQAVRFDPDAQAMRAEGPVCANRDEIGCNWLAETEGWCRSCRMTRIVPDLRAPENRPLWEKTELAKRWVLACLARWGWFVVSDPGPRPSFRLLSERTAAGDHDVVMGHAGGEITLNVSEAHEATRAARQEGLGEIYRTMVGHIRHEIAHFLFLRLSVDAAFLSGFRALFGDERADYAAALQAHYAAPKPAGAWHVTSYATAHPHEDWAETIAHLLHLTDLLDCAAAAGLALPDGPPPGYDAYAEPDTDALISRAVDLAIAVTHVNRGLDLPDLYPFVLTRGVRDKIGFAHAQLRRA